MKNKQKTIPLMILCFAFLITNLSLMQAPIATAFSAQNITCDALGGGLMFYGEDDQYVRFDAWYAEHSINYAWFNYSYESGSWTVVDLGTGPNENFTSDHVWYTHQLINTNTNPNDNVTASFKFSCQGSDLSYVDTNIITITIAIQANPNPVDNVYVSTRPDEKILISWDKTTEFEDSKAPVKNFTIYRKGCGEATYSLVGTAMGTDTRSFLDTTSLNGIEYRYAVEAVDYAGRPSTRKEASTCVTADGVDPSMTTYLINGTSALSGSVVTVYLGCLAIFSLTPSESLSGAKLTFTLQSGEIAPFSRNMIYNSTGGSNYYYTLYTIPIGGEALPLGVYSVTVDLTDTAGNTLSHTYVGQLRIEPPPDPTLTIVLIVLAIVAAGAVAGFVGIKRLKPILQARKAEQAAAAGPKSKRKGEIFKGASSLGRASGDEAEAILTRRGKQKGTPPSAAPVSGARPQPASAAELRSESSAGKVKPRAPENFETLDSHANAKDVKLAEKQTLVDGDKRADFLDARISSQENVMGVVVSLVEMLPETSACPKCGKPLVPSWTQCPWCLVETHSDELELKLSIAGIDMKATNVCPKCRAALNPLWTKCPYCAIKNV